MANEDLPQRVDPHQVAEIVSRYVRHQQVPTDQLAALIIEVHRALAGLARAAPVQEPPRPVVPIRRSVHQDYVICLECGYRAQRLRRHLRSAHGLDIAGYRTRWNLPSDHPLIAPSYSARRSTVAKQMGLGHKPGTVVARQPATGRRRRQRPAPEG
jgi:MucR family transcriptional regulator, transcriptional regulator of exopolysaccharide biosynthesis